MKRAGLLALIALVSFPGFSLEIGDFNRVVDFSISLKELSELVAGPSGEWRKLSKFIIFDGSVAAINRIDKNRDSFLAELEVVAGEWLGFDAVVMYKAYVYVRGPGYFDRMPARRPAEPPPDLIETNQHVLIVGQLDNVLEEGGRRFPVVIAHFMRVLP